MRVKFKRGKQKLLLERAISKAGSERKLKKVLGIPNQTVNSYRNERIYISEERLIAIANYLCKDLSEVRKDIDCKLDDNWGKKKGGFSLINKHKQNGTYEDYLKYLKKRGSKIFVEQHKKLKAKDPKAYSLDQFNRFKKSALYKSQTDRGEVVRNWLERDTANFLFSLGLDYEYEPHIKANGSMYFPDFKVNNLILECTFWSDSTTKIPNLRKKLFDFQRAGFNVVFVIPEKIKKFYKPIEGHIISDLQASVAQIVRLSSQQEEW